jgi:transposase
MDKFMLDNIFNDDEMKNIVLENDIKIQKKVTFKPYEIDENFLFPPSTDEYISKTHIARLISMIVDKMNITFILETYNGGGTSSYQSRMLLKVWLLGFVYRIYTSRRLETALNENLPFIWISGSQTPDFHTLNNFRLRMKGEIKKVFIQVVWLGMQLGLITGKDVFIDHTKIEANANRHKITWKKNVAREIDKIENELDMLFKYIERLNDEEDKKYGESGIKENQANSLDPVKIEEMINKLNDELKKN